MEAVKKEAAPRETTQLNNDSVQRYGGKVKLLAYAAEKEITFGTIADTARSAGYIKCSKASISMASRSEDTGVELVPNLYPVLYETHGEPSDRLIRRRSARRTKPCRLQVRLTESELRLFNAARGAFSVQDYLHGIIMEALRVHV